MSVSAARQKLKEIYMVSSDSNKVQVCSVTVWDCFCQSEGGSDLGLQLFVRSWQHLAVLRGEAWRWGSRVR